MAKLICAEPTQLDLFPDVHGSRGAIERQGRARITAKGQKVYDTPRGYAARPGSGPAGETCRGCRHRCSLNKCGRSWHKCGLLEHRWTNGPGTDIRLKSPACQHWAAKPPLEP